MRDALDKVCGVLPKSIRNECQIFVDQNAMEVMELIAQGVQPEEVCKSIGLCKDSAGVVKGKCESYRASVSAKIVTVWLRVSMKATGQQALQGLSG